MMTKNANLVQDAVRLFEADIARQPYTPSCDQLVVSPETARERLATSSRARGRAAIYHPKSAIRRWSAC